MARQVLSRAQRVLKKDFAIDAWLRSAHFKRVKDFYYGTIEDLAKRLGAQDQQGEVSKEALRLLLAVFLREDDSFAGFMEKQLRGSSFIQTNEGWTQIFEVAAGALLERFLRTHPLEAAGKAVFTPEQVIEEVKDLLSLVAERGELAKQEARRIPGVVLYSAPHLPALQNRLEEELVRVIGQEVLLINPVVGETGIPQSEREHEIAKRALANLQLNDLRQTAEELNLVTSGSFEIIASRIATSVHNNESDIAELVLQHERPTPERALTTRLIALSDLPEVESAYTNVHNYTGHYMRIGIAKWFVVRQVLRLRDGGLLIKGTQRHYQVTPRTDEGEALQLNAKAGEAEIEFVIRPNSRWVELSAHRGGDTKQLATSLANATGIIPLGHLPIAIHPPAGDLVTWSPGTLTMLDFLQSQLLREPLAISNLIVADFEAPKKDFRSPQKPDIRAVRLQGAHLLSSRQACELLVNGRGLIGLSLIVSFRPNPNEHYRVPVQIEFAEEHASVYTGLTGIPLDATTQLHQELVDRLKLSLARTAISAELNVLTVKIIARASEPTPIERADILIDQNELQGLDPEEPE